MLGTEQLFYQLGRELLADAMRIAYHDLCCGKHQADVKADGTVVTPTDKAAETILRSRGSLLFPDIPFEGEEEGLRGNQQGRYRLLADPLDGTRLFKNGAPGSAMMLALYDTKAKLVAACHVGCIATRRIWSGAHGKPVVRRYLNQWGEVHVSTNKSPLGAQSSVHIDVTHAFHVFDSDQMVRLFASLQPFCKSHFYGSNCMNQALVANGGIHAAVTTAKGGAWDLAAGCCLVPAAGGVTYAFRADGDGPGKKKLVRLNELDPFEADILVMGNTHATADAITEIVTGL